MSDREDFILHAPTPYNYTRSTALINLYFLYVYLGESTQQENNIMLQH